MTRLHVPREHAGDISNPHQGGWGVVWFPLVLDELWARRRSEGSPLNRAQRWFPNTSAVGSVTSAGSVPPSPCRPELLLSGVLPVSSCSSGQSSCDQRDGPPGPASPMTVQGRVCSKHEARGPVLEETGRGGGAEPLTGWGHRTSPGTAVQGPASLALGERTHRHALLVTMRCAHGKADTVPRGPQPRGTVTSAATLGSRQGTTVARREDRVGGDAKPWVRPSLPRRCLDLDPEGLPPVHKGRPVDTTRHPTRRRESAGRRRTPVCHVLVAVTTHHG